MMDVVVATAIMSAISLIVAISSANLRRVHPAVLALQAATVEARSIAQMQQADGTNAELPSGATVSVAIDPMNKDHSIISVFRSRPIRIPNRPLNGAPAVSFNLPTDVGFPAQRVSAIFTVRQFGRPAQSGQFSILFSSAGFSSIIPDYVYVPGRPVLTADSSCSDAKTTIEASLGNEGETYAFNCRDGVYDASKTQ